MINNVVCRTNLNICIDLRILTYKIHNIVYNPAKFSGVQWKNRKIGGHCMLFSSGQMLVNGKTNSIF